MKNALFILISVLFMLSLQYSHGQDTVRMKNGNTMICKVIQMDSSRVYYTKPGYNTSLVFNFFIDEIERIDYADGRILGFTDSATSEPVMIQNENNDPSVNPYESLKKNALKTGIFSPLFHVISLTWEGSYKPKRSVEATLGLIVQYDYWMDKGFIFKIGHKWIYQSEDYLTTSRQASLLDGVYLRTDAGLVSCTSGADHYTKIALLLNPGMQWVLSNVLVMDIWAGIGVGTGGPGLFDSLAGMGIGYGLDYPYGFLAKGLALGFGFKLGILF